MINHWTRETSGGNWPMVYYVKRPQWSRPKRTWKRIHRDTRRFLFWAVLWTVVMTLIITAIEIFVN